MEGLAAALVAMLALVLVAAQVGGEAKAEDGGGQRGVAMLQLHLARPISRPISPWRVAQQSDPSPSSTTQGISTPQGLPRSSCMHPMRMHPMHMHPTHRVCTFTLSTFTL